MTCNKNVAQNIIEFVFVFLVTMSIFLSVIELGLYWRAKYSVANIANEIIANIQIVAQNSRSYDEILNATLVAVNKSAALLNLSGENFDVTGENGSYVLKSSFKKQGQSALVVFLDVDDLPSSDIRIAAAYCYSGIFLFNNGKTITSSAVYSIQKY